MRNPLVNTQYAIAFGVDLHTEVRLCGPFKSFEEAIKYAEESNSDEWVVRVMHHPEECSIHVPE